MLFNLIFLFSFFLLRIPVNEVNGNNSQCKCYIQNRVFTGSGTVGGYMSGDWADDVDPMNMIESHPIILSLIF
jgi:hypothetical protein